MLGLRTSDLAVDDETGADNVEEDGGKREGFPVSMDESTESRNYLKVSSKPSRDLKRTSYTHFGG